MLGIGGGGRYRMGRLSIDLSWARGLRASPFIKKGWDVYTFLTYQAL